MGLPESTFRRYYQKADAELSAGLATRTEEWQEIKPILDDLVDHARAQPVSTGDDLVDQARITLLTDVDQFVEGKISVGAALMGVTAPTYKRWLEDKNTGGNDAVT